MECEALAWEGQRGCSRDPVERRNTMERNPGIVKLQNWWWMMEDED
jgi:hypothetical protein